MGWSSDEKAKRIVPRRWRQAKLDGFFMRFPVVETADGPDRGLARRGHECSRKILRSDQDGSVEPFWITWNPGMVQETAGRRCVEAAVVSCRRGRRAASRLPLREAPHLF